VEIFTHPNDLGHWDWLDSYFRRETLVRLLNMDILFYICAPIAYLIFLAATVELFHRKGHSWILGLVAGIFLPIISLLIALIMPYDQPALEERKQRELIEQQRNRENFARWQAEYNERHSASPSLYPPLSPNEEAPAQTRAQTICASLLIACPLIAAFQPGETMTGILGIAAVLSLIGLFTALLIPPKPHP
jgi:hypothetical protein